MDKKKLKRFWNKYKLPIIIVVLLAVFVVISTIVGNHVEKSEIDEWLEETQKKQYIVTVLSQTTCSHCMNFKPIMTEVQQEYGFKLYWQEYNTFSQNAQTKFMNSYDLRNNGFTGTPYTFITYDGVLVAHYDQGEMSKEQLVEFLTTNGVISSGNDVAPTE